MALAVRSLDRSLGNKGEPDAARLQMQDESVEVTKKIWEFACPAYHIGLHQALSGKGMSSNWRNRPRPSAQSLEQGRPYNRQHREIG